VPLTITVVTPSLNQAEFIEKTIISVLSQKGNFKIDYLIMDGGSSDDSLQIIEKYGDLLKNGLWPIQCCGINYRWQSEADNGQADAINKGFNLAKGNILGWLNSDDIILPGAFNRIVSIDWGKYGLCYGQGRWIARDGTYIAEYPTFRPHKYSLYLKCTLCQPTVYFSKETFARLGALSLHYKLVFDYEYWLRAVFHGEKFKFVQHQLAESRMYHENKSLANSRAAEWESWQLKNLFYKDIKLSHILLYIYRYLIEKKTFLLEKLMLGKIGEASPQ